MAGIRIIGTGSFPGDKIVTNSDMEKIVDTSDQWIVSKTGIRSRYFADKLTNADMAYEAAVKALDDAKITDPFASLDFVREKGAFVLHKGKKIHIKVTLG